MEIWDVYDKNGNKKGRYHRRIEPLKPGDYHMVVENWIKNSKGEFLIQKRNKPLGDYNNPWSTTAGSAVSGESSISAVQRETVEEMGIDFKPSDFTFIQRHFFDDFFMDVYETEWNGNPEDLNFDPVEVAEVKWVTLSEIQKMYESGEFYSHTTDYLENLLDIEDKPYKYFRIHTADHAYLTKQPRGLFTAIGKLVDKKTMNESEIAEYWKNREWFEKYLPIPPFYKDNNPERAITWFKNSNEGQEMFSKMTHYIDMAKKYKLNLYITETSIVPGKIIYDDKFQIAVTGSGHSGEEYITYEFK